MDTKLTLKLDKRVIDKAEKYAASQKKSLSKMIESYLKSLTDDNSSNNESEIQISPFVKSLSTGVKIPADMDYKKEYDNHLIEKKTKVFKEAVIYRKVAKKGDKAKGKLKKFKIISEISDLSEKIIEKGLASNFNDFEDYLQYHCALTANCKILSTRNAKDFKESEIPLMTAEEYLKSMRNK